MTIRKILLTAVLALISISASAATITVHPGMRIQNAIDRAKNRDTVIINPGTYRERLNMLGKNITLRSSNPTSSPVVASTIIDSDRQGPVITFAGTESSTCVISGLTLTDGSAQSGGSISGNGARATILNNRIQANRATNGGAIANIHGIIQDNTITSNTAEVHGGAIYNSNGTIQANIINENRAGRDGGALADCSGIIQNNIIRQNSARQGGALAECNGRIRLNTIYANRASIQGGGIFACDGPTSSIQNCIIWANQAPSKPQIADSDTPSYSCIQNWTGGSAKNISADPLFANPRSGNLRLQPSSPAIDAGADLGEFIGTSQDMRVVFIEGGFKTEHIRFDTYLASWPAYEDVPRGSELKPDALSASVTLGNIMLSKSREIKINALHVGPLGRTGLRGDLVTTGIVARFTVQTTDFSTGTARIRMGLSCAGRTDHTSLEPRSGGSAELQAVLHGSFTPEQLANADAFIYSETKVAPFEMVGEASRRLEFTLQSAKITVHHDQSATGSLRDFEGDRRPYDGSTARRGDGSDFDMGADEYDGTQLRPDLVIDSIAWKSEGFSDAETARVDLRIRNGGNAVSTTCTYTVTVDGREKIRALAPPMSAGVTIQRRGLSLGRLTSGTHTITATVDVNKTQAESNESNNSRSRNMEIIPFLPDLQAMDFAFTSATYSVTQTVRMNVIVLNSGIAPSPSCKYSLTVDGTSRTTGTLPGISAGTTRTLPAISVGRLPQGTHNIGIILDSARTVRESNESNNTMTNAITITKAMPDLNITSIDLPSIVTSADDFRMGFSVQNIGDARSSASAFAVSVDGTEKIRGALPALNSGAAWTTRGLSLGQLAEGSHAIAVTVDANNAISEFNEHNNQAANIATVQKALPDLRVENLTLKTASGTSSDTLRYSANIRAINSGQAASASCQYTVFVDGKELDTLVLPGLEAGQSWDINNFNLGDLSIEDGHQVSIKLDTWNVVPESNETNNLYVRDFGLNKSEREWSLYR